MTQPIPKYYETQLNYGYPPSLKKLPIPVTNDHLKDFTHPTPVRIYEYSKQELQAITTFKEMGSEFVSLNEEIVGSLKQISSNPSDEMLHKIVRRQLASFLTDWGKKHNLKFTEVFPVDTVYRNVAPGTFGAPSVNITHIDFAEGSTQNVLDALAEEWQSSIETKEGASLSVQEIRNLPVVQMINTWMPLNEKPIRNTLTVLDQRTLEETSLKTIFGSSKSGKLIPAKICTPDEKHRWVFQKDMHLGDALIFDSQRTCHSAVDLPEEHLDHPRRSIECRSLFVTTSSP